ncbi:MAG: DUF3800 domain-containing protein [Enterobacteriaceae bacterium]|nr:DUF3800 domain-containing protein [Enterobacteriaceae bacterium]
MNYYIDESGTTGDLINKKIDLFFSNQPIFTHACLGMDIDEEEIITKLINEVKNIHNLPDKELKCEDLYFKKPEVILDIAKIIKRQRLPLVCEVMDKKYDIAISIVNHIIIPTTVHDNIHESRDYIQKIGDLISRFAEDFCFKQFFTLCSKPCESNLLKTFELFYDLFKRRKSLLNDDGEILELIKERRNEYFNLKNIHGEECLKWFYPIPDYDTFDNKVALLPNVHSFYHILARLNKYHCGEIKEATIYHDTQKEYSKTLIFCCENIIENNTIQNKNTDPRSDYNITDKINLEFIDSKTSCGIQLADIIAGFLNRFINGRVYKNKSVLPIYDEIFTLMTSLNRLPFPSPLGVNFVLPVTIREKFMPSFGM